MRNTNKMLRRTIPRYMQLLAGATVLISLTGCGWDSELRGYDFSPSEYAVQTGYPDLLPASAFRISDYSVPDPSNLLSRFAMLKRKITALRGPVLTPTERARLEAAVKRTAATQG